MKKVALLIDGGHLRQTVKSKLGAAYNPDFIEKFSHQCYDNEKEELYRILYYDCPPYTGMAKLPVSGNHHEFKGNDSWLKELAKRQFFAVRMGVLKFRGWVPKKTPVENEKVSDDDFRPNFEQKGVDMRIGLDIAMLAERRAVERVILITADTDFIPAMKHGRKGGLQIVSIQLPSVKLTGEFLAHVDINRPVSWPD